MPTQLLLSNLLYDLTYFGSKQFRWVLIDKYLRQSKSNHTINHYWNHEQYIQSHTTSVWYCSPTRSWKMLCACVRPSGASTWTTGYRLMSPTRRIDKTMQRKCKLVMCQYEWHWNSYDLLLKTGVSFITITMIRWW